MSLTSDNPIRGAADDTLGRAPSARDFANHVLALDCSEGLVVGVLGAWGSGKTSFVNMAREHLDRSGATLLDFNPWMFSGAEQLVESFFVEIAAQLKVRPGMADVGNSIEDYGESFSGLGWLPLVGPWIERGRGATKLLGKLLQRRKEGIGGRREKVIKALKAVQNPIVVVLDDIDRLSTPEIRDVFKLVRLTASFPNIIYVVAFDRIRVEEALSESGVPGRDYLEKILQVAVDLPAVPPDVVVRQIASALDAVIADVEEPGRFDEAAWPDVLAEVIHPLTRNMRDVRRYTAAVHGTVRSLAGQIALVDVLGLEAIRVFLPDVFALMPTSVEALTKTASFGLAHDDSEELKTDVDRLLQAAGQHEKVVRAMIERLFPAAQRHVGNITYGSDWQSKWLLARRVAHEDVLRLYLERVAGEGFRAFTDAEQAWSKLGDDAALDGFLRSLDPDRLQDVIAQLEHYTDQYTADLAVPAATVLLNLLPELPERPRGMFDSDPRFAITRVVLRLLRPVGEPDAVADCVSKILPKLGSLSAKRELLELVGHEQGAGHKLVSQEAAAESEKRWRAEVRAATAPSLAKEHDLLRVLLMATRGAGESEDRIVLPPTPELTAALLKASRSDVRSQSLGSRAVHRKSRLAWDALTQIFGDEATLIRRVGELRSSGVNIDAELLQLADKYAGGWRPREFGDAESDDDEG